MNLQSIKHLKDLQKHQVHSNIKLHKICLLTIIIIDIILIIFIIAFKSKICKIKLKSNINKLPISWKKINYLSKIDDFINHKLVNIFSISMNSIGNFHFSLIFDNSEEVKMVKEMVKPYKSKEYPYLLLIYQGNIDNDESSIILDLINYYKNTLTIIKTKNEEKFGFFFDQAIIPNKDGFFESNTHNCFIFSFQEKERYYCKITNKTLKSINKHFLI